MSADERTLGERVEAVRLALSTDLFQDGLLRAMVSQEAAALLLEQQAEIERLTANEAERVRVFERDGYSMMPRKLREADEAIDELTTERDSLRAEVERQRQQLAYLGGTVEVLSLSEQKLKAKLSARDAEVEEERQRVRFLEAERANCDADYAELEAKLSALDVDLRALREVLQHIRSERRKLTRVFLNTLYRTFGLLDQDNNPTPLLTGKPGPGGEG